MSKRTKLEDEVYEILATDEPDIYDDTPEPDNYHGIRLMPGLDVDEIEQARRLSYFTKGLMLVSGYMGQGKGLFSWSVAYKLRRYFGKRVFSDTKPRRLFDHGYEHNPYIYLDDRTFCNQLNAMKDNAEKGQFQLQIDRAARKEKANAEKASQQWLAQNTLMLQDSVLLLDEFWRYMHNRRPHNPMGLMLGGLIKLWRHLDILIIGITQSLDELDAMSCLPYVTYEVDCSWCTSRPDTTKARIKPMKYVGSRGVLQLTGRPFALFVDGGMPREELNGKRYFDLYNSKNLASVTGHKKAEL